jgi:prolyl-tRNA synthetase
MLYQIQTKFRDEPRPRAGLLRVREFTMKDAYTFDRDEAGIDAYYPHFYQAYFNIFHRCGIDVVAVKSDTGMMGGRMAHEFMALTDIGEDTLVLCDACGYSANRQIAVFRKPTPPVAARCRWKKSPRPMSPPSRRWRASWASPKAKRPRRSFWSPTSTSPTARSRSSSSSASCAGIWSSTRPS